MHGECPAIIQPDVREEALVPPDEVPGKQGLGKFQDACDSCNTAPAGKKETR